MTVFPGSSPVQPLADKALQEAPFAFVVTEGLRTLERQKQLVAIGASKTLNSRHLTGHAVDLVPVVNGKLRWEIIPCCAIAEAVRTAAREIDVRIRWGGCWDAAFDLSTSSTEDMVSGYVDRRKAQGKRAFIDGPHFEIPAKVYP